MYMATLANCPLYVMYAVLTPAGSIAHWIYFETMDSRVTITISKKRRPFNEKTRMLI